jgi:hypothetical protein
MQEETLHKHTYNFIAIAATVTCCSFFISRLTAIVNSINTWVNNELNGLGLQEFFISVG